MRKIVLFIGLALVVAGSAYAVTSADNVGIDRTPTIPTDLSVPSNILLIEDQAGWGFGHVAILAGCGIQYSVINSGQIASTNFMTYDKIVTAGQQPDNFYYTIQAETAKFTDYMNAGGCVSFEVANYFGGANEFITWPGGFTAVISGGSNTVTIMDPNSCLMQGVTNGELQNWNYSSHGTIQSQPAGYATILDEPAGSTAGRFPWGNGGAYVAHQPLEWGFGFGYSQTYPRNFDCCSCEGAPVATESATWGKVKSLFR